MPCVYALFWLVSIASYVLKSPSICFQGTKYEINPEDVLYFHSVVYLHCRRFYNDICLVPKFRNGKKCWRKLEKENTRLKPEMTGFLCFSPRRIFRLPRYSLTFGFPWTRPSVHSPWYNDITVLLIWHEYKHYFDSEIRQIDKVCLDALLTFLSARASCEEVRYANELWNGIQCACAPSDCVTLKIHTSCHSKEIYFRETDHRALPYETLHGVGLWQYMKSQWARVQSRYLWNRWTVLSGRMLILLGMVNGSFSGIDRQRKR